DVRLHVVHPAAHRRIERDVLDLDQQLAVLQLADRLVLEREVGGLRQPDRPRRQREAMIHARHVTDGTPPREARESRRPIIARGRTSDGERCRTIGAWRTRAARPYYVDHEARFAART